MACSPRSWYRRWGSCFRAIPVCAWSFWETHATSTWPSAKPALVRRLVGRVPFRLFASDAYVARRGRPASVGELAEHDFIAYGASLDRTPPMVWLLSHLRRPPRIRCTLTATVVAACAAGQGIAITMPQVMTGLPGVSEVLPRVPIPHRELWAVIHSDLRSNPRVKAVLEWAASAAGAVGIRPIDG